MTRALSLGIGATLLATGCNRSPFDTIVVDISPNCNVVAVEIEHEDLTAPDDEWVAVLAAASDGPGTSGWWLLVHVVENDDDMLALAHVQDGEVDASVPLGLPLAAQHVTRLRTGPRSGEAWVVHDTPDDLRVWQVDVAFTPPLVWSSPSYQAFPDLASVVNTCTDEVEECEPSQWFRDLAFLSGQPFMVSIPPFSPDSSTRAYAARLPAGSTPAVAELEFSKKPCDPTLELEQFQECEVLREQLTHPSIHVLGIQRDPHPTLARFFLLRTSAEDGIPQIDRDRVVISLFLGENNIADGNLKSDLEEGLRPIIGPPSGLAVDHASAYGLHTTATEGPRLVRVSETESTFETIQGLELTDDTELLQLDEDIALSRIVDGRWVIDKLFPDAPEQSRTTEYEGPTPIVDVDPAGPGSFLVHRGKGGPDLVHVRCTDPFTAPTAE